MTSYNKNRTGFTLIEVIVTMILMAVLAVALLGTPPVFLNLVNREKLVANAYSLASAQMEDLKTINRLSWNDTRVLPLSPQNGYHGTTLTCSLGNNIVTYMVTISSTYLKKVDVKCDSNDNGIHITFRGYLVRQI